MNNGPLRGLKVVDFTELGPGPFFTQCLVEMGADLIKVERPPHGDMARLLSPGGHKLLNVGKATRTINLKDPEGLAAAKNLVRGADIIAESSRPGVMERLGLGYQVVAELNPGAVYVSITGYGQHGPLAAVPGHDINYLATSGVLALSGVPGGPPAPGVGIPVGDFASSMYALSSTLAAVIEARSTGHGQHVDVSITDCLMHWMNAQLGHFQHDGIAGLDAQREAVFNKPAYAAFRARDGQWLAIAAMEEHFWARLVDGLELTFTVPVATRGDRVANSSTINEAIAGAVGRRNAAEVLALLEARDVPVSLVVDPDDLRETPHAKARGVVGQVDGYSYITYPVQLAGMDAPRA
jgi:crotonobetainyl-CoA:carnitine CoA-transferase CaiB-like acyl-CoA transferase